MFRGLLWDLPDGSEYLGISCELPSKFSRVKPYSALGARFAGALLCPLPKSFLGIQASSSWRTVRASIIIPYCGPMFVI